MREIVEDGGWGGSYSRWSFFFASLRGEPLFFELAYSVSTHKIKKPDLKRERTFLVPLEFVFSNQFIIDLKKLNELFLKFKENKKT